MTQIVAINEFYKLDYCLHHVMIRSYFQMMDLSQATHCSGSYTEPQKSTSKVPIRASKQSSAAKVRIYS